MRLGPSLGILVGTLFTTTTATTTATGAEPDVAVVFEAQVKGLKARPDMLERLTDYVRVRLAETGRFSIVPDSENLGRPARQETRELPAVLRRVLPDRNREGTRRPENRGDSNPPPGAGVLRQPGGL